MSDEPPSARPTAARPGRPPPGRLTPADLERAALGHLQRYAASVEQLRRVLGRRIDRLVRAHGLDRAEAHAWLEALLDRLIRSGLLDDRAFAETKAHALRSAGRSAQTIAQKLRQWGVAEELVERELAQVEASLPEREAARVWARKRRLGPYRQDPALRQARRERDLAALARAGFSEDLALELIDGELEA